MVVQHDIYTGNNLHQRAGTGFTRPRGPLCSSCSERAWFQDVQLLTKGVVWINHCRWVLLCTVQPCLLGNSLGSFKKQIWLYGCPYALIFGFMALIFNEMKVTQIKHDWGRKRDGRKTLQLHFKALILISLPHGWENIFRIQYAQLQNKCINIGIFPTDGCVQLRKN